MSLYAETILGGFLEPSKGVKGVCPICKEELVAKCGLVNIWHFSHKNSTDCDSWSEGETLWHQQWKKRVPKQFREVVIKNHRADVVLPDKTVLELQNSPISTEEIIDREIFYGKMIWLFNCISKAKNIKIWSKEGRFGDYHTISWKWHKRTIKNCSKPVFLDFGLDVGVFELKKLHGRGGWGFLHSHIDFCKLINVTTTNIEELNCEVEENE